MSIYLDLFIDELLGALVLPFRVPLYYDTMVMWGYDPTLSFIVAFCGAVPGHIINILLGRMMAKQMMQAKWWGDKDRKQYERVQERAVKYHAWVLLLLCPADMFGSVLSLLYGTFCKPQAVAYIAISAGFAYHML